MTASGGRWVLSRHLRAIDTAVVEFIRSNQHGTARSRILILDSPPRHGKSEYISKHLTAWFKACYPHQECVLVSYEGGFAASWGGKARRVLATPLTPDQQREFKLPASASYHPRICDLFGHRMDPQRRAASEWGLLGYEGSMRTAGAGGPITGKGANLLVIDDPIKNSEEALSEGRRDKLKQWLESTIQSRLEPNGCLVLMATRWHREDLSGLLLNNAIKSISEPVYHIHLPAISVLPHSHEGTPSDRLGDWLGRKPGEPLWPERWPLAKLLRIKRGISTYWWESMYQGNPTAHTQAEWPDHYFNTHIWVKDDHWPNDFDLRVITVDPSKGRQDRPGDYCAITFIGVKSQLIYVDSIIQRIPLALIATRTLEWAARYHPHYIGIEATAFQELLAIHFEQQSRQTFGISCPVYLINHGTISKPTRIRRLDPYLTNYELRFRASNPDNQLLVDQLRDFPLGDYDDGPDSLEMAIRLPLDVMHLKPVGLDVR